jgi:hypothetical protein
VDHVGPIGQPGTSIVLHPPAADPGITDEERRTILELITKGVYTAVTLATDDLDGLFDRLQAAVPMWSRNPSTRTTESATAPSVIPPATSSA